MSGSPHSRARAEVPERSTRWRRARRVPMVVRLLLIVALGIAVGMLAARRQPPPAVRHARTAGPADVPIEEIAAQRGMLVFAGGIVAEGLAGALPPGALRVTCQSQRLPLAAGRIVGVEVPPAIREGNPRAAIVEMPGWTPAEVAWPPPNTVGAWVVTEPVMLRRLRGIVTVRIQPGGCDYDLVEFEWAAPQPEEAVASEPPEPPVLPLDFQGARAIEVPTGIYRVILKSRTADRVRDFVLVRECVVGPAGGGTFVLPASLSRTYVGLADQTPDPQDEKYPIGFFCGFSIDVRNNRGTALLAFETLRRPQTLSYETLRPRPDTVWPVSNLFLADPAHLTFDCPLSHADHRVTLDLADGRATVLPEIMAPEDPPRAREALERMRRLILAQARETARRREWFDPRFVDLPAARLPNHENLESEERYARHLARIASSPARPIEVGAQVSVRHGRDGAWSVRIVRPARQVTK